MKVITITNENQHEQAELVGDGVVTNVLVGNGAKYLTVREPTDEELAAEQDEDAVEDLESLTRETLDEMADELGLDHTSYRTKALIADAIRESKKIE